MAKLRYFFWLLPILLTVGESLQAAEFSVHLKNISLQTGLKQSGNTDLYRYLASEWASGDSTWNLGFENESNLFGLIGRFQEYRVYAHHYGQYDFLPQWNNLAWFLGASVASSQFVSTALSPDLGFKTIQPIQMALVPLSIEEDISIYADAIQFKTQLQIFPLDRVLGWPLDITPTVSYLWFGTLAGNTSGSLGVGLQVSMSWE